MARTTNKIAQDAFIAKYIELGGRKRAAAEAVGVDYHSVKRWLKQPAFKEKIEEAESVWYERLIAAAIDRAEKKSDTLLIFLLKARYPELFDDNIRQKRFMDEIVDRVRSTLPVMEIQPQPKLEKPIDVPNGDEADSAH